MSFQLAKAIYPTVNSDSPESYLHGNKTKALYSIVDGLAHLPEPQDFDKEDRCWMHPCKVSNGSAAYFSNFVDELFEESVGKRKEPSYSSYRRHLEQVLLNLTQALIQNKWLLVALDEDAYSDKADKADPVYLAAGWRCRTMRSVIRHFEADGLIHLRPGKRYKNQPLRTRIFPTPALAPYLYPLVTDVAQSFDAPYVLFNRPSAVWESSMSNIVSWEEAELQKINEFLEPHDWAAKGPVRLIYHTDFLHGGRLYTPYQNIPTRRVDVRKRTLIDGEPLSEVDFSANQLRLQLAVLFQLNAGDDPYGEIATIACIQDIQTIKTFMVIAMGADSRAKAAGACWKKGINKTQFDAITEATWRRWPRLELFTGWTHQGQNLEGQILKKVLLHGVDAGIVCLPVHDAVAVQRRHVDWAVEAMTNAWAEIAYGLRPKVKVE